MKRLILLLLMVSMAFSQPYVTKRIDNSKLMRIDTLWVVGDTSLYTPIFWQAGHNEKSIEISMDDTSSTGFASDSAAVSVTVKQVFDKGLTTEVRLYNSLAYTSGLLYDSLDIADMDTTATWLRNDTTVTRANQPYTYRFNTLDTLTTSDASAYIQVVPDYSPGILFMVTGLANNKKGSANRVVIRWYQVQALPVSEE